MTKLETLKAEYSKAEERMKMLEKEIKELEEKDEETKNKLNESIDFIKRYCDKQRCCEKGCKFYDVGGYTRCSLKNTFPIDWEKIK